MDDSKLFAPKISLLGILLLSVSGCATVNVPNVGQTGYALQADERRIFKRADEAIEALDSTDYIYADLQLEQYLTQLANQLLPQEYKTEGIQISIRVLNDPSFNAFALPNGRIYVHIGALAATENEAQVASLLAHEMTHVLHRHALKQFRSLQNKTAFMSVLGVPLGAAGGEVGMLLGQLGVVSSIYGYSREHETEADTTGFDILTKNNYDVREAPKLFKNLEEYIKMEEVPEPFFFSTHPHVKSRIENFERLISEKGLNAHPGLIVDSPRFQSFAFEIYLDQINLCLIKGMYKTAEKSSDYLIAKYPQSPEAYCLRGELFYKRQDHSKREKKRDKNPDYAHAIEFYEKALALRTDYAPAVLGKGRSLDKLGKKDEAKTFYKKYLDLQPGAPDRKYIEQMINNG